METQLAGGDIEWAHCCRLCSSAEGRIDIFQSNVLENLPYIITCLLDIVVEPSFILPTKLCATCFLKIQSWQEFKMKCMQNEMLLQQKLIQINSYCNNFSVTEHPPVDAFSGNYQAQVPAPTILAQAPFAFNTAVEYDVPANIIKLENEVPTNYSNSLFYEDVPAPNSLVHDTYALNTAAGLDISAYQIKFEGINVPTCDSNSLSNEELAIPESSSISSAAELDISAYQTQFEGIDVPTCDSNSLPNEVLVFPESSSISSLLEESHNLLHSIEDRPETKSFFHTASSDTILTDDWETLLTIDDSKNFKMEEDTQCETLESSEVAPTSESYELRPRASLTRYVEAYEDEFEEITPWKCDNCASYFAAGFALRSHLRNDDCIGNVKKFPCLPCKKNFLTENSFAKHNLVHLTLNLQISDGDLCSCAICDLRFADVNRCKLHVKKHVTEKVYNETSREFSCSLCVNKFRSEDLLYDHRFAAHGIHDERISCVVCSLKFRQKCDLEKHSRIHSRCVAKKSTAAAIRCRPCSLYFENRKLLDDHEKSEHPTYKCQICHLNYRTRTALHFHYGTHNADRRLKYPKVNPDNEVENPKSCKRCNVIFKFQSDYDVHYSLHIKVGKTFKCEVTTGSEIRFYCSLCPQLFVEESEGETHVNVCHRAGDAKLLSLKHPTSRIIDKLFLCNYCHLELKDKAALNFHKKKVHPD